MFVVERERERDIRCETCHRTEVDGCFVWFRPVAIDNDPRSDQFWSAGLWKWCFYLIRWVLLEFDLLWRSHILPKDTRTEGFGWKFVLAAAASPNSRGGNASLWIIVTIDCAAVLVDGLRLILLEHGTRFDWLSVPECMYSSVGPGKFSIEYKKRRGTIATFPSSLHLLYKSTNTFPNLYYL